MSSPAARSTHDRMNAAALRLFPVVAAIALALAVPRLLEGAVALPGNGAIEEIRGGAAGSGTLDTLIASRTRALAFVDRGKFHSELSYALRARAGSLHGEERSAALERAVGEADRGILQSPADPIVWYHLAAALFARDGAGQPTVDAVLSSIAVGPYETELLVPRIDLLFAARSYLSQTSDETVDGQVRVAWKRRPVDLVRAIRRHGAADIVRRGLEREPSMAQGFDGALKDPNLH
jgi:hypothetical protein